MGIELKIFYKLYSHKLDQIIKGSTSNVTKFPPSSFNKYFVEKKKKKSILKYFCHYISFLTDNKSRDISALVQCPRSASMHSPEKTILLS